MNIRIIIVYFFNTYGLNIAFNNPINGSANTNLNTLNGIFVILSTSIRSLYFILDKYYIKNNTIIIVLTKVYEVNNPVNTIHIIV